MKTRPTFILSMLLALLFTTSLYSCKKEKEKGEVKVTVHKLSSCTFYGHVYVTLYKDGSEITTQSFIYGQGNNNALDFGLQEYGSYVVRAAVGCGNSSYYEEIESSVFFTLDKSTAFAEVWL